MNEETITVPKHQYEELVRRSQFLARLEEAGVNNWEGYEIAQED